MRRAGETALIAIFLIVAPLTAYAATINCSGFSSCNGTDDNDTINGTDDWDDIFAYGGNDTAYGHADQDELHGAFGCDTLRGHADSDVVIGGGNGTDGSTNCSGGLNGDQLMGNTGNDTVDDRYDPSGSDIDDACGGDGNDNVWVKDNDGSDTYGGGPGADSYSVDDGQDTFVSTPSPSCPS